MSYSLMSVDHGSSCFVALLRVMVICVNFATANDVPELNMSLTRQQITTHLGHAANLGCYVTEDSPLLSYTWSKGNRSITQSLNLEVFGNILVVTPKKVSDFGTYVCNVSNAMGGASCRILLVQGWNKSDDGKSLPECAKGCVNIAVLMPILTAVVISVLFNIHLLVRRRRQQHVYDSRHSQIQFATDVVMSDSQEEEQLRKKKKPKLTKCLKRRRRVSDNDGEKKEEKQNDRDENVDSVNDLQNRDLCIENDGDVIQKEDNEKRQEGPLVDETAHTPLETDREPVEDGPPRLADFYLNDDDNGDDDQRSGRESLDSEEPLVSHYMEKMEVDDTEVPVK